jgi:molybdate transport system substrate-binding protein
MKHLALTPIKPFSKTCGVGTRPPLQTSIQTAFLRTSLLGWAGAHPTKVTEFFGFALTCFIFLSTLSLGQELNVFAASSLNPAFQEIAVQFEAQNPDTAVVFNFAGSSTLATQIIQGAPADVFASADSAQMQVVADAGVLENEALIFTRNRLVVITPSDSDIQKLGDLAKPGVLLVLAETNVPVGKYSRQVLENLNNLYGADFSENVLANLVSEEPNVKQVATKVELGEADVAIVYITDAATLQHVRRVEIPDEANVTATYPIAALKGEQKDLADTFIDFVLSPEGQDILAKFGFLPRE